jgi:hypothetical protein
MLDVSSWLHGFFAAQKALVLLSISRGSFERFMQLVSAPVMASLPIAKTRVTIKLHIKHAVMTLSDGLKALFLNDSQKP